jgi:hypothetical protein
MKARQEHGHAPRDAAAAPRGGTFFREGERVDANKIVAMLREDGKMSKANPRKLSGFGEDGLVGVAVHPPRGGYWAVVDSADGSQGIGRPDGSRTSLIANHLLTDAIWYRVFAPELALVVHFFRGSNFMQVVAGDSKEIGAWLAQQGVPVGESPPPKDAGSDAVVVTIKYAEAKYRSGPDAGVALELVAIRDALVEGDHGALRKRCESLAPEVLPLGLGVLRAVRRGAWDRCQRALAHEILGEPMRPRTKPKEMTLDEEVLRCVADLAAPADESEFVRCLDRLDEIEADAERRSSLAFPASVALLASQLEQKELRRQAYLCYQRLLRRSDQVHWVYVVRALFTLLTSATGPIQLDSDTLDVVRRCEARVKDLGGDAPDTVYYSLACVYGRAGAADKALAALAKCGDIKKQNPHPEQDTDLELLWNRPEFRALVEGKGSSKKVEEEDDAEATDESTYVPPEGRAVPRWKIELEDRKGADEALINRIGGRPNAPSPEHSWPESAQRPMQFVLQLVGVAGGGEIEMGDVTLLSVFADLEGDYYEPSCHTVVMHRGACSAALGPPPGTETRPVRAMRLHAGADDRLLLDSKKCADKKVWDEASAHAWCNKVRGVPVGANLDRDERDSRGEPMECLLQLVSYDNWFLWYVFVNRDFSEARLQIVRG